MNIDENNHLPVTHISDIDGKSDPDEDFSQYRSWAQFFIEHLCYRGTYNLRKNFIGRWKVVQSLDSFDDYRDCILHGDGRENCFLSLSEAEAEAERRNRHWGIFGMFRGDNEDE